MATTLLFSVLFHVIMCKALHTPELTHDSTPPSERFHLTSRGFPSQPPAYSEMYYINCSIPECYLDFQFEDLDLPPGSQIKIRDAGAQWTLFNFIQNNTYVSARPTFSSESSSISIFVNITRSLMPFSGFKANFESKVNRAPYDHHSLPWETRIPTTSCPELHEPAFGELQMSTASFQLQCIVVVKAFPGCDLYLRVIDITEGLVAEVIRGNNSEAKTSSVRLKDAQQFVWSTGGLYIRFMQGIGTLPKSLTFAYGCYGPIVRSQTTTRCVTGYFRRYVGLKCHGNLCLFTNGSYCDGISHCPDGEDESSRRCKVRTTTQRTTRRSTPVLWYLPTTPSKKAEPTEHAPGQSPFIYIVYALVPLLILVMIGCIFYRMTLTARDIFGRRLVYPRMNYYDGSEACQPPPDYDVALTHPKPVADPSMALPSYEQSNADHAPAYEDIFPHLSPGSGPQPPPGEPPPPTVEIYDTPVTPMSFNATVSSSENMPRLLTRYSQVDISHPPTTPEDTNSESNEGATGTQGSQFVQQPLDVVVVLDSEKNKGPESEMRDDTSSVESGVVETSRL